MTTYQFQNVDLASPHPFQVSQNSTLGIGAPFTCCVMSAWFTVGILHPGAAFGLVGNAQVTFVDNHLGFSTTNGTTSVGSGNSIGTPVPVVIGDYVNVLFSIDVLNRLVSAAINDQLYNFTGGVNWVPTASPRQITNAATNWLFEGTGCVGDVWFGQTDAYVDLATTSNRRKFINADLTPVSLGADGSAPFGTQPPVFLHIDVSGAAADFLTNLGSGGAFTAHGGTGSIALGACGVYPPTVPSNDTITVGDLWYGPTTTFVDLRATSNRRLFVGVDGATQFLGDDGSRPTGAAPPIFLTLSAGEVADDWPDNAGTGGAFMRTGPDLQIATGIPPCGGYTIAAPSLNNPQGADPQLRLSVSDDGGRTFSLLQKWRSIGLVGEYTKRLRWLKMGVFRQRQMRLEVTDPVRRNIVGFYQDISEGLDW